MSDDYLDDDELSPPDRPDFRRVGRGIPFVVGIDGKRVRYSRSSNAGKILDDESNLTDWKLRTVVAGAAQRPELMASASVLDVDTDKKKLREIAEECLVAGKGLRRSIIGTAVHAMFDHIDRNDDWTPPPQFNDLVDAYVAHLEIWGLVPVGIEIHCINDEYRLAGTCDRRYRTTKTLVAPDGQVIPIGSIIVADTKTGKELEYAAGSYATQLAAYVDSVEYNVETDERIPFDQECVKDWALIIHADSMDTRIDVYWVDIRAGRLGLQLAREVKAWRNRDDLLTIGHRFTVVAPPVIDNYADQQIEADESVDAIKYLAERVPVPELPTPAAPEVPASVPRDPAERPREDSRTEYLAGRVRAVLGHSDTAGKALQLLWPKGIPGLKAGGHSWEQLSIIQAAIERVERDHSVPWYPEWNDPDVEEARLAHPSNVWARPETTQPTQDDRENIQAALAEHPRANLIRDWLTMSGRNESGNTVPLAHALFEFAKLDATEWNDADLTTMLDGSLRALGYEDGIKQLGQFNPPDGPKLMSAAFAIVAGNAMLLFDENERPVVRTIGKGKK